MIRRCQNVPTSAIQSSIMPAAAARIGLDGSTVMSAKIRDGRVWKLNGAPSSVGTEKFSAASTNVMRNEATRLGQTSDRVMRRLVCRGPAPDMYDASSREPSIERKAA